MIRYAAPENVRTPDAATSAATAMKILPLSTQVTPSAIGEIAQRRLRESPYFFLKSLNCQFDDGVLTLRGRVPYGQLKKFAESIVSRVEGVHEVVNRIEVFDPVRGSIVVPAARNAG
jgi:osmotically-inducible protein OsmY